MDSTRAIAKRVAILLEGLKLLLRGHPPEVQGAVIGEALAIWLAAQPDFVREDVMKAHIEYVRGLIPAVERQLFNGRGHPNNKGRLQ